MRALIVVSLNLIVATALAVSASPHINWQAKLTDAGGMPLSGSHTLFFRIYEGGDASTIGSGVLLFSESDSVSVTNGVANYAIGTLVPLSISLFTSAAPMFLEVSVDTVGNVVLPRTRLEHVPFAVRSLETDNAIKSETSTYIATETTTSSTTNGTLLLEAYAKAAVMSPNGQSKSATNRSVVLVSPGVYDLGTNQLTLNTEFVDLVGLSSARDDQYIFGASNGEGTGVLRQTANNVRIHNLVVRCTRSSGGAASNSSGPAAYFPDSGTTDTRVANCEFKDDGEGNSWSTRVAVNYPGTFTDCVAGIMSFGGNGTASGRFERCVGGIQSFAGNDGVPSFATGTFVNCIGEVSSFGGGHVASGTFMDCTAQGNSFGGSSLGTASGTFINCRVAGNQSFGGSSGSVASGTFVNCIADGNNCFGGGGGTASGTFTGCIGNGTAHFGGGNATGNCTGTFSNCIGGSNSFGGSSGNSVGAKLFGCRMTGATWTGTFGGRMENCTWSTDLACTSTARIYSSTIVGTLNLSNQAAGATQSRAKSITNDASNVFGATNTAAVNLEDPDVN